jgi:hypothetical protein
VQRIFVNAAIKKALCREAGGDRAWLEKVRPWLGHDYHFHVRLHCPPDSPECKPQPPAGGGDGCGRDLNYWFTDAVLRLKPSPGPGVPKPGKPLSSLSPACRAVLTAPDVHASNSASADRRTDALNAALTDFPVVMPTSSNHGMETALPTWSICTVMYFDPDTLALLRTTLDQVWAGLCFLSISP